MFADFSNTDSQTMGNRHRVASLSIWCLGLASLIFVSGCATVDCLQGVPSVSVKRVPRSMLGRPRSEMVPISMARLRQEPPKVYQLGPNDTLGVYIENVLGTPDVPPPVNFPEDGTRAPSIGFPIPVREDGTVALPLVDPIEVVGLTLEQATDQIRAAYTVNKKILPEGKDRIIVTLQKRRTERIMVIREESSMTAQTQNTLFAANSAGLTKRGTGETIDLPAYENDLLHALNETGGLPGLDAENEVLIIRGGFQDARQRELLLAQIAACRNPCDCPPQIPDDPNVVRIPIRYYPEQPPAFSTEDIILKSGDIVFVQSRDRELFYTGGAISGGSFPIPRDYDIDILQAIAISGGSFGSGGTGLARAGMNGGGSGMSTPLPPSKAIVIRKTCNGQTIAMRVDLKQAISDSSQRILIQPEDMVLVQFTCAEEIGNFLLRSFQINYLLGGGLNR